METQNKTQHVCKQFHVSGGLTACLLFTCRCPVRVTRKVAQNQFALTAAASSSPAPAEGDDDGGDNEERVLIIPEEGGGTVEKRPEVHSDA